VCAGVSQPGDETSGGKGGGNGGGSSHACWFKLDADDQGQPKWPFVDATTGKIAYAWFFLFCDGEPVDPVPRLLAVDGSGARPAARVMAEQAYRYLPLPAPEPAFNPPDGAVVGVSTWFWTSSDAWRPYQMNVGVTGLSVRVRATPISSTWRFAPRLRILVCQGAGTPYGQDRPPSTQRTDCSYTFGRSSASVPSGAYAATVTTEWQVEWSGSDGTSGQIASLRRTTAFRLSVSEVHTVVSGPGRRP
jgi:hypothetical protein